MHAKSLRAMTDQRFAGAQEWLGLEHVERLAIWMLFLAWATSVVQARRISSLSKSVFSSIVDANIFPPESLSQ